MTAAKRFTSMERRDVDIPLILKLDASGTARGWAHWQDIVTAQWNGKVLWDLGDPIMLYGGKSAATGQTSEFALRPIVALNEPPDKVRKAPPLTNRELFRRDNHICLYCGTKYPPHKLTRDHVTPTSKGGKNIWTNCVASCKGCNHRKADRTPDQAKMPLLAVPFTPNPAEFLILQNRRIIASQMEYLVAKVPKDSRILQNIQ